MQGEILRLKGKVSDQKMHLTFLIAVCMCKTANSCGEPV